MQPECPPAADGRPLAVSEGRRTTPRAAHNLFPPGDCRFSTARGEPAVHRLPGLATAANSGPFHLCRTEGLPLYWPARLEYARCYQIQPPLLSRLAHSRPA